VKELRTALLGEDVDSDASGQAKAEVARAAKGRATDPEAHRLYLLARHLIDRMTREDMAKATEYLREALERDPEFALAWSELGFAYTREAGFAWIPVMEGFEKARDAVTRALALEADLPEGHARLGWIQMYHDRDWRGAEASFRRALELAPRNAEALSMAGSLAYDLNRLDESIGLSHRALEQDPLSSLNYNRLGLALHHAGRFEEAVAAFHKALELAPQRGGTRAYLSLPLYAMGREKEALAEATAEPMLWARLWSLGMLHHAMGHSEESDKALHALIEAHGQDATTQIAEVCAARGEIDAAFEWLDRAYADRDPGLSEMLNSPPLRSLHGDPRWAALVKKMGFEG